MKHTIRKSATDKSISGVCGGLAEHFGISSFSVRLVFIFLPGNVLIYLILVNIMGDSPPSL
ncbi:MULTISPECIES: PspC domain-containing protein [Bacillaceae]|uniref:PspC domain-containing protein n=1 Tax=Bacillaceae TaxID=186817 RepID=UPI001E605151|nr:MULTISPECIES: PspC domain-containing protein [Bacillaceae]MCE4049215.1 PspC domain-containing protein [Bacillus sp. Au-Bac7]MCM3033143.1 PspC domain-containing protein [Niallia sp. MER 6]UPO90355.1 PspC domain-containing protein [Niallia sp. Man26]